MSFCGLSIMTKSRRKNMLEKLTLLNFQQFEKKIIVFDSHVTVIVGPNGAGKSTIIRALRWLMFNQPLGARLLRWGSDSGGVRAVIDKAEVVRWRGKENVYKLNGETYHAVGGKVPDAISQIVNVTPENLQRQFDAHFWFADTPGKVSRALNAIVNLDSIDSALAAVSSELRKSRAEAEVSKRRLQEAKSKRDELKYTVQLNSELKALEGQKDEIDANASKIASVASLVEKVSALKEQYQNATRAILDAENAKRAIKAAQDAKERTVALAELVNSAELLQKRAKLTLPDTERIDRLIAGLNKQNQLRAILVQANTIREHLCETSQQLQEAEASWKKLTKGKNCPLCGTEFR
jgi:exonuclease SbcC